MRKVGKKKKEETNEALRKEREMMKGREEKGNHEVGTRAQKERREEKSALGREGGREGWTDGRVGPQRRVIHHTTMQSALSFSSPAGLFLLFLLLLLPI